MADVYTAIVESQSQDLSDKIARITDADAETLLALFNELKENKQSGTAQSNESNNFNGFIENTVNSVLDANRGILDSEPLQLQTSRTYVFGQDFDISVRGMIETKSTNHHFYQFDYQRRRDFIAPVLAEKLLSYHKLGSYAAFV